MAETTGNGNVPAPIISNPQGRPNQAVKDKGRDYYFRYVQWMLWRSNCFELSQFRIQTRICWEFYMGNSFNKYSWLWFGDIQNFLNDETGQVKFRQNWIDNIIMPMVRMYIGNGLKSGFTHTLKNASGAALSRKQSKLDERRLVEALAKQIGGDIEMQMRQNLPIGDNEYQTKMMFEGEYKDPLIEAINDIIVSVSENNDLFTEVNEKICEHLAVDGMAVVWDREINGHQVQRHIPSQYMVWDVAARRKDLQDGAFIGHIDMVDPVVVYEEAPWITESDREKIENWASSNYDGSYINNNMYFASIAGKVRRVHFEFRDCELQEWGVVMSEYGFEMWVEINAKGDNPDEEPLYTDKDLIPYSKVQNPVYRKSLKKKNKLTTFRQVIREVDLVDGSYYGGTGDTGIDCVVLYYGKKRYTERDPYIYGGQRFSYKVSTFKSYMGIPTSPTALLIDAQRIVNRVEAIKEQQLNASRPPSLIYDESLPTDKDKEYGIRNVLINGGVAAGRTRGNAPNMVREISGTNMSGQEFLDTYKGTTKRDAQLSTGGNETIMGAGTQELVRNSMIQAQMGSIIQEDFYNSVSSVFKQLVQAQATRGTQIYRDNPDNLMGIIRSQECFDAFMELELANETVFANIKRSPSRMTDIEAGNQLALQMLQAQLLDEVTFARIINRSTVDDVYRAMSRAVMDKAIAQQEVQQQDVSVLNQQMAKEELARTEANLMQMDGVEKASQDRRYVADKKAESDIFDSMIRSATEVEKSKSVAQPVTTQ